MAHEIKTELLLETDAKLHAELEKEVKIADPTSSEAEQIINESTIGRRVYRGRKKDSE